MTRTKMNKTASIMIPYHDSTRGTPTPLFFDSMSHVTKK